MRRSSAKIEHTEQIQRSYTALHKEASCSIAGFWHWA